MSERMSIDAGLGQDSRADEPVDDSVSPIEPPLLSRPFAANPVDKPATDQDEAPTPKRPFDFNAEPEETGQDTVDPTESSVAMPVRPTPRESGVVPPAAHLNGTLEADEPKLVSGEAVESDNPPPPIVDSRPGSCACAAWIPKAMAAIVPSCWPPPSAIGPVAR